MIDPDVLELDRVSLDLSAYRYRQAKEADYNQLISRSTVIRDASSREISIVYLRLDTDCSKVTQALQQIRYDKGWRTAGLESHSRIFGYTPRVAIRHDYCHSTTLAREDPLLHATVALYSKLVSEYYQQFNPDLYSFHQQEVAKILPEWTLEDSVFTSGIINKNNPLAYHFDTGNFQDVWSNMLVFKHDIQGGYLSVPEYNVGFEVADNTLLMFDGQNLLHGVTPIRRMSENAYRYSIVYYSLQQMWRCLSPKEEVTRIRKRRTMLEEKRLHRGEEEEVHGA